MIYGFLVMPKMGRRFLRGCPSEGIKPLSLFDGMISHRDVLNEKSIVL